MSMLVTMGAALSVQRAKEVSIRVKNVYSLDFGKCKALYQRISQETEDFGIPFKESLEDTDLKDKYVAALNGKKFTARFADAPEKNLLGEMHQMYRIIGFRIEGQFDCFRDMEKQADPFLLKKIVDSTMGITPTTASLDERIKCFNIMKETGFLKTHHKSLASFVYNPGLAAKKMLRNDPKIQTLIFGCGRNVNYIPSCEFIQHENALFIDRASQIHPDVLTDIHNEQFWQEIPTARLQNLLDHTNGQYVFEDPHASNTIKNIYRVLKPGGCFTLAHPWNSFADEQQTLLRRQMLEEAGFTVESDDQTTFYKNLSR